VPAGQADRYCPSSQLCCACGHQAAIGWGEEWDCPGCGAHHHRDDKPTQIPLIVFLN
jgi:transposase